MYENPFKDKTLFNIVQVCQPQQFPGWGFYGESSRRRAISTSSALSLPLRPHLPSCAFSFWMLFLLLDHTVSECLSALQTKAGLLSTGSSRVYTLLCIILLSPYIKEGAAVTVMLVATTLQYPSIKGNSLDGRSVIK